MNYKIGNKQKIKLVTGFKSGLIETKKGERDNARVRGREGKRQRLSGRGGE